MTATSLEQTSLLRDLPDDIRDKVVAGARTRFLAAGDVLFHRGDAGRDVYVVLSGALDVVDDSGVRLNRLGPGQLLGERAHLNGGHRSATVRAARDAQVACIAARVMHRLIDEHPGIIRHVASLLADRLAGTPRAAVGGQRIAVINVGEDHTVAERLAQSLARFGSTAFIDAARVDAALGAGAAAAMPGTALAGQVGAWLDRVEATHAHVVLAADGRRWTARCVREADAAIAIGAGQLRPGALPAGFTGWVAIARHGTAPTPGVAVSWLAAVPASRLLHVDTTDDREIDRLARIVTGRGVALVLGGGGARGFAHLGVLRAFETCGVPIDAIGGTSIGALMGALAAMGWDDALRMSRSLECLVKTRRLLGWTLPLVSLSSATKLTKLLRSDVLFGDTHIEDLPISYFAVSASFNRGEVVVHDTGPLWLATRASASLPGILPPVCVGDDLLVDGGVVNNVPVDVMRDRFGGRVVAVDLRGRTPPRPRSSFDPGLSGWKVLASRLHPRRDAIRVPGPAAMMLRAKELGGKLAHSDRLALADLVLEPPVADVDNLDFRAGQPLVEPAYRHTVEHLERWLSAQDRALGATK